MVKKISLLIILTLLFHASAAAAGDLLVVQSLHIAPYNKSLQGFTSVCAGKTSKLISSELSEAEVVRNVRKEKPALILAIGLDALTKVRTIRDVPVVYLMVLNPDPLTQDNNNVTGVGMNIQPERQLSTIRQILPQVRKIGVLFDTDKSGAFLGRAQNAARMMGIELLTKRVHSPSETAAALDWMKGKIDVFWMLPDTTVVNPGTIDLLLLASIENRLPVFTFSEKYVEKGALLSLEVDALEAGKQAGEMANRVLAGTGAQSIGKTDARGGILTINLIVAKKLGITINSDAIKRATVIR